MANKRNFLLKNTKEASKNKSKLEEKYKRLIKEDEFDDNLEDDTSEEDLEGGTSLEGGDDLEGGSEEDFTSEEGDDFGEYTPEETEFMDQEVDTLLEPAIEQAELAEEGEADWDSDLTAEELEAIQDSDDSYGELGSTLQGIADEDFEDSGEEDFSGEDLEFDEEPDEFSDETDLEESLIAEAELDSEMNDETEELNEDEEHGSKPSFGKKVEKSIDKGFSKLDGFTSKIVSYLSGKSKEEAMQILKGVAQTIEQSSPHMMESKNGMRKSIKNTLKKMQESGAVKTYAKTSKPTKVEADDFSIDEADLEGNYSSVSDKTVEKVKEPKFSGVSKTSTVSKVKEPKFDKVHEARKAKMNSLESSVNKLKLESYALSKANGLLTAVGHKLDTESRLKISESFGKCSNKKQIDTLYEKIVQIVKVKSREALKESVIGKKKASIKTVSSLNEVAENNKVEDKLNREQKRINMLMGLDGYQDSYLDN